MAQRSFLQSNEWAEFQKSLGREVLEYEKEGITARVFRYDLPFGKNYLYVPHGPEMDFNQMTGGFKNPVANFVRWLRDEGKKNKAFFVKIEPLADSVTQALVEAGFRKSNKEIQPSRTVMINLEQSEDELLGRMHHKTRYNINVADRHGVTVSESRDLDYFLKLLKKTTKRDRFSSHPDNYYKKLFDYNKLQTKLYFANRNDRPIAAALVLIYGNTGYYLHGASDYDNRSLMAPYALYWHIIKQLKLDGLKQYDFWGIDSSRWPGVTRFKLNWGGRITEYPGSFDLPVSRAWYLVYKIARYVSRR